jgi:formylglycine-generating enzyme required for sulfatase activity
MKECTTCRTCFPDHINYCPLDGRQTLQSIAGEPILDGRYQLEKRLGQGGMGVVYKAHHVFLKSLHAIKVILPDLVGNDPTLATRFRQEAMAAAAIRHPNIIAVTDYGLINGIMPFLVMEFIPGRSLHDLLEEEGKFSPSRAMDIMTVIAAGVGAAHQRGIVHRDLKPLNIMIEDDKPVAEAIKILDFGLAKIKSGDLLGSFLVAQTTGMIGSPLYMAPEQWSDEEPDLRADIYSLGIVLYQMLAGNVPFEGTAVPTIMKKHLMTPPPPFAAFGVVVPPAVERVVRHALEKDPQQRPASADEFIRELRAAVMGSAPSRDRAPTLRSSESELEDGTRTTQRLRRLAEDEARRKAEEETARRLAAEEARKAEEAAQRLAAEQARRREEEKARLLAEAEAARKREEEEARRRAEAAARFRAAEEARKQEEARLLAEVQAARKRDEEAARRKAEEAARLRAAEEARKQEEEEARLLAEAEAARKREEEQARRKAEEEAARRLAAERARKLEEERKRKEEEARLLAEAEAEAARKREEEEARRKAEEEAARIRAAEEQRKREEEEARLLAEAEAARKREEEEALRKAEEEAARIRAEEARKQEEEEARLLAEAEAARKREAEEARREAEEEAARIRAEEARKQEEEKAQLLAEAEAARKREAEEARRKAEEEAARIRAAEEQRQREEEEARLLAEAEAGREWQGEEATLQISAEEVEEYKRKEEAEKATQRAEEEARQEAREDAEWQRVEEEARHRAEQEAAHWNAQEEARRQAEQRKPTKKESRKRGAKKAERPEPEPEPKQPPATVLSGDAMEQTIAPQPMSPQPLGETQLYQGVSQPVNQWERGATEIRDTMVSNYPPPVSQQVEAVPHQTFDVSGQVASFGAAAPALDLPVRKKSLLPIYLGIAVLVLLLVGGVALYLLTRTRSEQPPQSTGSGVTATEQKPQPGVPQRDMSSIPGGTFQMGRDDGPDNERPAHSEPVKPFDIDKTEVTNAQYAEFVQATAYPAPVNDQGEKPYWSPWVGDKPPAGQEQWPVRNVSAVDAETYARWLSKRDGKKYRLPTEKEWEYVARNGGSTQLYPWGNEWKNGYANIDSSLPKPVGSFKEGATTTGVFDMIGNVQEWTSSNASFYDQKKIPAGEQGQRVIRGGSYRDKAVGDGAVTATTRSWVDKTTKHPLLGFRLVREAP